MKDRSAVLVGQKRALELAMSGAPVAAILDVLVRAIESHTADGMIASLQFVEDGRLRHGAAPNLPAEFNALVDGHPIGPLEASCGAAAYTGEPVTVADIATDPRWAAYQHIAHAHGLAACWSMPIRATDGSIVGTFAHYYTTPRDPTPPDLEAVEWIANTAALVIERDRDARTRREAADALHRQVHGLQLVHELAIGLHAPTELEPSLDAALDVAIRLHEAPRGVLFLYRGEQLEIAASRGFDGVAAAELMKLADDGTPIRTRSGKPVGTLVVQLATPRERTALEVQLTDLCARYAGDAVERARAVREIRAARDAAEQANHAKDEFLAILGHELRNPLAPIASALQLLEVRTNDEHVKPLRAVIERQLAHLTAIVDDLQDVARIRQGKIQLARTALDVGDVIARAVEMTAPQFAQRGQTVTVQAEPGLCVHADPTRLAQIISNLLVNASKYSDAGTTTTVVATQGGGSVSIAVRDQGIGLAPEMVGRVFDLFTQDERALDRAHGGLGIGLAIVRKLVDLHGGSARVHSDGIGRGSTFTITLPAHIADTPAAPARKRSRRTERTRRILVVDDNTDVADMMAELLTDMGHVVRTAHDGESALAKASAFAPEIALLDLGLPVMDGYELARQLGASGNRPFLVAVTGYGRDSDQQRVRAAGFDAHLVKPVSLDTVLGVIDAVPG